MSDDDQADKQFDPTPKKLEDARKKGDVPKSTDLTTAAAYGGFLISLIAVGAGSVEKVGNALSSFFELPASLNSSSQIEIILPRISWAIWEVFFGIAPILILPAVAVILMVFAQQSLVFAPSKLEPKLSRISVISNAKQKFGRTGLFEFGKSFFKLVIYSLVLGLYLKSQLGRLLGSLELSPAMMTAELAKLIIGLLGIVLIVAITIGGIDFIWQKSEHIRKNRMTRKEMTDEVKQSEGDPAMKQQRRQKAIDIAMNQMLAEVPQADVIIVNPTHYAVALKWDRSSVGAPICVAKGVDEIALKIREVANENDIPIHSDPPSARALHASVDIGDEIPPEHYKAVAAAIRFAESLRNRVKR